MKRHRHKWIELVSNEGTEDCRYAEWCKCGTAKIIHLHNGIRVKVEYLRPEKEKTK